MESIKNLLVFTNLNHQENENLNSYFNKFKQLLIDVSNLCKEV